MGRAEVEVTAKGPSKTGLPDKQRLLIRARSRTETGPGIDQAFVVLGMSRPAATAEKKEQHSDTK